ncbi:MAG: HD domain-containing protein [Proteobacteria bacterium]|nr:HD domain-containing protein [Pseudomonadota bacterium]
MDYREIMESALEAMGNMAEINNPYKKGHHKRVSSLSGKIAEEMGIESDDIYLIRVAASIHDIGEIAIPIDILCKVTRLTHIESMLLKEHPEKSFSILKDLKFPGIVAETILQHHERIDGSGYPRGLKGNEILRSAKIISVADTVDAIISDRSYHYARPVEQALKDIEQENNVLYDPEVVDACTVLFRNKGFTL